MAWRGGDGVERSDGEERGGDGVEGVMAWRGETR
jgi:hypothetical protein